MVPDPESQIKIDGKPKVGSIAAPKSRQPAIQSGTPHARLRDRAALRNAIVMAEILAPPVAMRPPEQAN